MPQGGHPPHHSITSSPPTARGQRETDLLSDQAIGRVQRTRRYAWPAAPLLREPLSNPSVDGLRYLCEPSGVHPKVRIFGFGRSTHAVAGFRGVAPFVFTLSLFPLAVQLTWQKVCELAPHRSSGRSERLMRVTTGSHARFSSCGYTRSKQWIDPFAEREKLHRL